MTDLAPRTFAQEAEAFRDYARRNHVANLDYSYDSVAVLDGVLAEARDAARGMHSDEAWTYLNNLCLAAGSYVGEVLVRNARGIWACDGDGARVQQWWVRMPANASPVRCFEAVWEFLERGPRQSLLHLVAGHAPSPKPAAVGEANGRAKGRGRKASPPRRTS